MGLALSNCGTHAGFARHKKANEEPCQPCRDALNLYNKEWKRKHTDQVKASRVRYRKENLETCLKSSANWRKNNPDYIKNWHKNNRDKVKLHKKKWVENNPESVRKIKLVMENRRRARMLNNGFESYKLDEVISQYGTNCHICNKPIDFDAPRKTGSKGWEMGLQLDHVIPVSKGGSDTIQNVRPSHGKCNSTKRAKIVGIDES